MGLQPTTTQSIRALRDEWRRTVLPALSGDVLDVGAGTGAAADHLGTTVRWIALEPSRSARRDLSTRVRDRPESQLLAARAEDIPLPDASVDAVIAGTVLCSVRDPARALAQIRRVLRPGGRLVFFEHVVAPAGTWTRVLQRTYAPLSRIIDAGCDPARDTETAIRDAGFQTVDVRSELAPGILGTVDPLIQGIAVR
ncbi:class I SAM-dependent methyltransferase [Microbacterium mangrovi]|uniref:class I SAM-dependent methyltransferase n=1 Tax=Microbacterium mangrovi TaxID=1348253 RepID=UPI0022B0885B|nr:class I SAM-dependent methyltransferase [Microbacterium mangrovi]